MMTPVCEECKSYKHEHGVMCSKMPITEKAGMAMKYYETWKDHRDWAHERIIFLRKEMMRWQGKFLVVKNENNKLRKKLTK